MSCCCPGPTAVELPKTPSASPSSPSFFSDPKAYEILNQIARIALTAIALIIAPIAFIIAFPIGVIGGGIYYRYNREMPEALALQPVCARGYAEMLAQAKFPPLVNLLVTNLALSACLVCQTFFYAPFCGFYIGFYVGQKGGKQLSSALDYVLPAVKPITLPPGPLKEALVTV
jgi:hypothetical protein